MINLLPPEEKEHFLLERKKRIVIILWLLTSFFLICFILILFSIKVSLQSQVEIQKSILSEIEEKLKQNELQEIQEKISSFNLTLEKLKSFYQKRISFAEILEKISEILPSDAYFTDFSVVSSDTEEKPGIKIFLSGFISSRDSLLEFKNNLEKESNFKDVYFPPTNWVKSTNIEFYADFKINL